MKKIITIILVSLTVGFYSCGEYEPGGTATQKLSGDWYVTGYVAAATAGEWDAITDPIEFTTYNTAANVATQFFIDDLTHFWHFKGKVVCNVNNYTFGYNTDTIQNLTYDSKFLIYGGKVLKGLGKSFSGVTTDSIVFYVRFDDDATPYGVEYKIAGHRKTGFLEDLL